MSCPANRPGREPLRSGRARTQIAVSLMVALAALSGCSTDAQRSSQESGETPGQNPSVSPSLATASQVAGVYGRLPGPKRAAVRREVVAVLDEWWAAAYLAGDYPRSSFADPFPGFTPGAAAQARQDKLLMTNRDVSEDIDSVIALSQKVKLDVLAVGEQARSVTARFRLRFDTESGDTFDTESGDTVEQVLVSGRVFMTRRQGKWRIFGYDVTKGEPSAEGNE